LEQRLLSVTRFSLAWVLVLACAPVRSAGAPIAGTHDADAASSASPQSATERRDATQGSIAGQTTLTSSEPTNAETHGNGPPQGASATQPDELPRGTLVLHVGDSFAGSLGVPLGQRLKARGLRSVLEFQTSSYVPTWASGTELPGYVARYSPDLVIVTLGANEFELANPEQRASSVRRLVHELGGRPCVWVSPPSWKQDTGILAVIRANVQPCRYLDSDSVVHDLERRRDGIHPSDSAREVWADAVLAWLIRERRSDGARPWDMKAEAP
jgi:lysophospholipase L1-like esterase